MLFYRAHRRANPLKDNWYWSGEVGQKEKNAYFTGMRIGFTLACSFVVITCCLIVFFN